MTSYELKRIAIISMLIDHIGAVLVPPTASYYLLLRGIGRIAFPIFAFLIVEGFFHTRDIKKYLLRLGAFALVSEIPFNLSINKTINYPYHQNIFFTLFLGLGLLFVVEGIKKKNYDYILENIAVLLAVFIFAGVAYFARVDYGEVGILIILLFYYFRKNSRAIGIGLFVITLLTMGTLASLATLSIFFIMKYNGEQGNGNKIAFYIFYPGHLLALYIISLLI